MIVTQMPVMVADEFRRNVRNYLQFMCNHPAETRAVEEFCQMPGGYGRIADYLASAGVSVGDVTNLLNLSERTKAVFHRMKNHAVERYRREEALRNRRHGVVARGG